MPAITPVTALLANSTLPVTGMAFSAEQIATKTYFSDLIQPALAADRDIKSAEAALEHVANGDPVEIHEVMIDLERARLSVLTLIQIRNKALEAYQELMRMQV